jgi:hypothetical protein
MKPTPFLTLGIVGFHLVLAGAEANLPEPGPENVGLRLRFIVVPERSGTNDTYQARFDLINVTNKPITLIADWLENQSGGFGEYLATNVNFTTDPAVMPYMGQTSMGPRRTASQPKYTLRPGETLTVTRTGKGRHTCPTDGLYGFRASILLRVEGSEMEKRWAEIAAKNAQLRAQRKSDGLDDDLWESRGPHGSVLLRSNEQQVPVGGSHGLPKFPMGSLMYVDTNKLTATFGLGSAHRVEEGDQFRIFTGSIGLFWILKITHAEPTWSMGTLEPLSKTTNAPDMRVLRPGTAAALITANDIWR